MSLATTPPSTGPRIVPGFLVEIFNSDNRFVLGIALLAALGGIERQDTGHAREKDVREAA